MPVLIPAGAAAVSTFFGTTIIGGITVGSLFATVALSGASYLINKALAPKIGGETGLDRGVQNTIQSDIYPERLIYGRAFVGGRLFFYECKPPYLYLGLEIASHEIDAVEQVYINGKRVSFNASGVATSANFVNGATPYFTLSIRKGAPGQAIDPILAADFPELPATFRQQGHACVVIKCYYGSSIDDNQRYWSNAVPQLLFLVRGMKVYDPTKAYQRLTDPLTWEWSNAAALIQAHFMTYGLGMKVPWSAIDMQSLKEAARRDSEGIAKANGAYEIRYAIDGVVDPNTPPADVLQDMLTANLGKIVWSNGVYKFLSGVARDPVWTLNNDSARGEMQVRAHRDRSALVNTVRTVFIALDREYQTVNGPVLENAGYIAADGQSHEITIQLPFTSSQSTAQRIARITMEKARRGRLITRRESIEALRLEAADIINIEIEHLPVLNGVFEVNTLKLDHDTFEVEIEAEEYSASTFDWLTSYEQPFTIAPAQLAGVN